MSLSTGKRNRLSSQQTSTKKRRNVPWSARDIQTLKDGISQGLTSQQISDKLFGGARTSGAVTAKTTEVYGTTNRSRLPIGIPTIKHITLSKVSPPEQTSIVSAPLEQLSVSSEQVSAVPASPYQLSVVDVPLPEAQSPSVDESESETEEPSFSFTFGHTRENSSLELFSDSKALFSMESKPFESDSNSGPMKVYIIKAVVPDDGTLPKIDETKFFFDSNGQVERVE